MKKSVSFVSSLILMMLLSLILIMVLPSSVGTALADGAPVLLTNKYTVAPGERFALSWEEPDFDEKMYLWKRRADTDGQYEFLAEVPNSTVGYGISLDQEGCWGFCLIGTRTGRNLESGEVLIDVKRGGGKKPSAEGITLIYSNKVAVETGERFALSWDEKHTDGTVGLWKRWENNDYEYVAEVPASTDGYVVSLDKTGTWYFALTTLYNGNHRESDEFSVLVGASPEDGKIRLMEEQGKNNVWNILFVIYEEVNMDGFRKSFLPREIARIENYARYLPYTVSGITDGRMEIGTVETVRISEPITSVSGWTQEGLRVLTFGPGKDVNLDGLLEGRDVNIVAVWAPLAQLAGTENWVGVAPFYIGKYNSSCYALIVNALEGEVETYYEDGGFRYIEGYNTLIHEMLHCVEANSWRNGWTGYEPVHSLTQNGYDGKLEYLWFRDLTRDRLKNGKSGFHRESFYVKHQ